jgi:hypothetical protein
MELPPTDFESAASASSAIPARDVLPSLTRMDRNWRPGWLAAARRVILGPAYFRRRQVHGTQTRQHS